MGVTEGFLALAFSGQIEGSGGIKQEKCMARLRDAIRDSDLAGTNWPAMYSAAKKGMPNHGARFKVLSHWIGASISKSNA